jgi:hypothetical protein
VRGGGYSPGTRREKKGEEGTPFVNERTTALQCLKLCIRKPLARGGRRRHFRAEGVASVPLRIAARSRQPLKGRPLTTSTCKRSPSLHQAGCSCLARIAARRGAPAAEGRGRVARSRGAKYARDHRTRATNACAAGFESGPVRATRTVLPAGELPRRPPMLASRECATQRRGPGRN